MHLKVLYTLDNQFDISLTYIECANIKVVRTWRGIEEGYILYV